LLDSVQAQQEYLEDNILLDDCHAAVLGRHQEAAEIHMAEGRIMEAIGAPLDDKKNEQSKRRENDCMPRVLGENTSFSRRIEDTDEMDKGATLLRPTQKDEVSSGFSHFLHQLLIPFYS
jgi:hypothetical protein